MSFVDLIGAILLLSLTALLLAVVVMVWVVLIWTWVVLVDWIKSDRRLVP